MFRLGRRPLAEVRSFASIALIAGLIGPGLALARALPEVRIAYGRTPAKLHDPYSDLSCCNEGAHTFLAQAVDAHHLLLMEGSGYGDHAIIAVELPERGEPKLTRIAYPTITTNAVYPFPAAFHRGRHGELYVLVLPDPVRVELYTRGETDTVWTVALSATRPQLKLSIGAWAARIVETPDDAAGITLTHFPGDHEEPQGAGPICVVARGGRVLEPDQREWLPPSIIASSERFVVRDRIDSTEVLALPDSSRVMSWLNSGLGDPASYLGMDRAGRVFIAETRYKSVPGHNAQITRRVRRLGGPEQAPVEYSKREWEFFNSALVAPDGTLMDLEFRTDGLHIRRWTDFRD